MWYKWPHSYTFLKKVFLDSSNGIIIISAFLQCISGGLTDLTVLIIMALVYNISLLFQYYKHSSAHEVPLPSLCASFLNSPLQVQVVFLVTLKSPLPAKTVTPALLSGVVWHLLVVRTSSKIQGPEANLSCLCNSKCVAALKISNPLNVSWFLRTGLLSLIQICGVNPSSQRPPGAQVSLDELGLLLVSVRGNTCHRKPWAVSVRGH